MATDAETLAAIDAAILTAVSTGKAVTFNGRSWTSHDLAELRELRADIAQRVAGGSSTRLAAFRKGV